MLFSDSNTLDYCRYTVEVVDGWSHARIPFVEANWLDKDLAAVNFAIQTQGNDSTFWLDNMRVLGAVPVELDDGDEQSAKAGETVTYTHALKNYYDETASFALSAESSRNWPPELLVGDPGSTYQGPFPLGAGMTTTVHIVLTIPLTETAGVTDTTTLVANGVDTIVMYSDSLEDITTVLPTARFIYLPLVMRNF